MRVGAREFQDASAKVSGKSRLLASHLPCILAAMSPSLDELLLLEPIATPKPLCASRMLVDHSDALASAQAAYEAGRVRETLFHGMPAAPIESSDAPPATEVVGDHPIEATDEPIDRLKAAEDDLYRRSLRVVDDSMRFAEIPYGAEQDAVPQAWVDELGAEEAKVRMRVAMGSQRGAKDAPFGLSMAVKVVTGLAKARAVERTSESQKLNVQVVIMPQAPQYPVLEVAGRDD